MIIFTSRPDLIQYLPQNKRAVVYNMSSLYSGYKDATALITTQAFQNTPYMQNFDQYVQTVDFDIQYAGRILSDPLAFTELLDIMQCDYSGMNAIILVQHDFYRDSVMESLLKLIQQRYGYNAWVIDDPEDIESIYEPHYTPMGIMQLNSDLEKYIDFCRNNVILNPVVDINLSVE